MTPEIKLILWLVVVAWILQYATWQMVRHLRFRADLQDIREEFLSSLAESEPLDESQSAFIQLITLTDENAKRLQLFDIMLASLATGSFPYLADPPPGERGVVDLINRFVAGEAHEACQDRYVLRVLKYVAFESISGFLTLVLTLVVMLACLALKRTIPGSLKLFARPIVAILKVSGEQLIRRASA